MTLKVFTLIFCVAMLQHVSGVIYTRWGRNVCPAGEVVLYTGYVAAAWFGDAGGAANYICVHNQPQKGPNNMPLDQGSSGRLFGVEYQIEGGYLNSGIWSTANNGGASLQNEDAVCVICLNPDARELLTVMGRLDCPSDMNLEYNGNLASNYFGFSRTEFICLDAAPESRPGGEADLNGGLLYPVQAFCGSLPCPPFGNYDEITCAVCTL